MLDRLRGGLIVSIQPQAASPLNTPEIVVAFARAAVQNGAVAVRIEGTARIAAVRAAIAVPIIGLIKRREDGFAPYITPALADAAAILDAGAEIVAFDATGRGRPDGSTVESLTEMIRDRGGHSMADCATLAQAAAAGAAGADVVATTLYGYTEETSALRPPGLELVSAFAAIHPFAVCEGGIARPQDVERAFASGAQAVVVGTAISDVDALVRNFARAAPRTRPF